MKQYDNAIHMMQDLGGSFVKALAELYLRADPENKRRAREAFPEYFARYELMFLNAKQKVGT